MEPRLRLKLDFTRDKSGVIFMRKIIGTLLFFIFIVLAGLGIASFLSQVVLDKPLISVIRDFLFILTRK